MTKQEIYYKIKAYDASFKAYITEFFNVVNSYFLLGDNFLNVVQVESLGMNKVKARENNGFI